MVMATCCAPSPKPIAIDKNKQLSSSGSFIAALNLTIDNAPTSPKDNASEDLTTVIINVVVIQRITKFLANNLLFDKEFPNFTYINASIELSKAAINKLTEKIKSELIDHKPINTLVHGDLWSGNVGVDESGKVVIFDPASWWADNEVDIAMTKLFGGFRKEFYEEYHRIFPIKKGLEKRIIIYNFYHILNHANMFGGGYLKQVKDYVKAILNM